MNKLFELFVSFAKVGVMLAQRVAQKIDYDYVYNMNILSIRIAK